MEPRSLPSETRRLAAVVLGAGLSRRMGRPNKLLLPFGKTVLVRRVVATIASLPFAEIIVATGHDAERVAAALAGLPVRLVHNPRYAEGQMTTVHAALAALSAPSAESAGVMVCLGDQPALTAADLEIVARAFLDDPSRVLVPTFGGVRGNPLVLPRASLPEIVARETSFGCRQFVAKNADLVRTFEMPDDHVLVDVDRPEDYVAVSRLVPA
jgi:molybdenum cofactor cytidylyltransferase